MNIQGQIWKLPYFVTIWTYRKEYKIVAPWSASPVQGKVVKCCAFVDYEVSRALQVSTIY